ncbi:MAG: threonine ammonia-lyase [Owenweeksia sp.]
MITYDAIEAAASRIHSYIHQTPVLSSAYLNELSGAKLFFKCENFQKTGSFKVRGATNSVLQLTAGEKQKGVATHSSGNHGQSLAWAAREAGVPAWIVMPSNAPQVKKNAVKAYGATVVECEPTLEARETTLQKVQDETGAVFIPPYNAIRTIEGQATCARELHEQAPGLDYLLVPVGGGGILSGSALSTKYISPKTVVMGCEPENADDACLSLKKGEIVPSVNPNTIADGLKTSLGDITFEYIKELVVDILLCSESDIKRAMQLIWERMKIIVEPSSAVALACLLRHKEHFRAKRVGLILTGGNVDLGSLPF